MMIIKLCEYKMMGILLLLSSKSLPNNKPTCIFTQINRISLKSIKKQFYIHLKMRCRQSHTWYYSWHKASSLPSKLMLNNQKNIKIIIVV